jgi:hypothetical protein
MYIELLRWRRHTIVQQAFKYYLREPCILKVCNLRNSFIFFEEDISSNIKHILYMPKY